METFVNIFTSSKVKWIGGTITTAYLLTQYAKHKFTTMLTTRSEELSGRQNLKNRFEYNLKDCSFVVQSLLPSLNEKLGEYLNVEHMLAELKNKQQKPGLLEESRLRKREMWNELKIKSFTRLLTHLYLVNLLMMFSTIQVSLLGRLVYLDSVANNNMKTDEEDVEHVEGQYRSINEDTERNYLTLSWFVLNVGWKALVERIQVAVEKSLKDTPLNEQIGFDTLMEMITKIRKEIDCDGDQLYRFDAIFMPAEGDEELILSEGGLNGTEVDVELKKLMDETRDLIECSDFGMVLQEILDESQESFGKLVAPLFFDMPEPKAVEKLVEIQEEEELYLAGQVSKLIPLAGVLPVLTRISTQISNSVPNVYLHTIGSNPKLKTFGSIIYGGWE